MLNRLLTEFVADHPRLTGALCTLTMLLLQAGSAIAKGTGGGHAGP